ncbi:hypothetical protein Rsub_04534 [Raphidocelis subcapitata]|uniref:Uncharacterized protein n=1 Tax=Raphidocelis subcapitata TaxID=307507 RepID=A0A2V0P3K1_9CHLO|nr:hypothetical protein Rsub_04534 [Raphidocelis subcapitata]|eukprot:GBF92430.1 hypothetical protein Rsub_04534 [Raphidocelis subcapitata]
MARSTPAEAAGTAVAEVQRIAAAAPGALLAALGALLSGLVAWATMMLAARSSMDGVFGDLGVGLDSLQSLKRGAAAAVGTLTPLLAALLVASGWVLTSNGGRRGAAAERRSQLTWVLAANGAAVLVTAFALAGSFAWYVDMKLISDAAASGGGAGPWWPPAASASAAPAPAPAPALPAAPAAVQDAARPQIPCPKGCMDLGVIAAALGLPLSCVCLPGFLAAQLTEAVGRVAWQLAVAVAGATLMVAGASWLSMLAAAQLALEGAADWAVAAPAGGGAREPLLPGGGAGAAEA